MFDGLLFAIEEPQGMVHYWLALRGLVGGKVRELRWEISGKPIMGAKPKPVVPGAKGKGSKGGHPKGPVINLIPFSAEFAYLARRSWVKTEVALLLGEIFHTAGLGAVEA